MKPRETETNEEEQRGPGSETQRTLIYKDGQKNSSHKGDCKEEGREYPRGRSLRKAREEHLSGRSSSVFSIHLLSAFGPPAAFLLSERKEGTVTSTMTVRMGPVGKVQHDSSHLHLLSSLHHLAKAVDRGQCTCKCER